MADTPPPPAYRLNPFHYVMDKLVRRRENGSFRSRLEGTQTAGSGLSSGQSGQESSRGVEEGAEERRSNRSNSKWRWWWWWTKSEWKWTKSKWKQRCNRTELEWRCKRSKSQSGKVMEPTLPAYEHRPLSLWHRHSTETPSASPTAWSHSLGFDYFRRLNAIDGYDDDVHLELFSND